VHTGNNKIIIAFKARIYYIIIIKTIEKVGKDNLISRREKSDEKQKKEQGTLVWQNVCFRSIDGRQGKKIGKKR